MTEQERQNRKLAEGAQKPKRVAHSGRARRIALSALLLLLASLVLYGLYRGMNGADSLRRHLSYNKAAQGGDGKAELYRYDSDRSNCFALLDDKLLVASTTRIQLLSAAGGEVVS